MGVVGVQPGPFDGSDSIGYGESFQGDGDVATDIHPTARPLSVHRGRMGVGVTHCRAARGAVPAAGEVDALRDGDDSPAAAGIDAAGDENGAATARRTQCGL